MGTIPIKSGIMVQSSWQFFALFGEITGQILQ